MVEYTLKDDLIFILAMVLTLFIGIQWGMILVTASPTFSTTLYVSFIVVDVIVLGYILNKLGLFSRFSLGVKFRNHQL